jgi:hypothetical protein
LPRETGLLCEFFNSLEVLFFHDSLEDQLRELDISIQSNLGYGIPEPDLDADYDLLLQKVAALEQRSSSIQTSVQGVKAPFFSLSELSGE